MLDFKLFPDVLCEGKRYSNYDESSGRIIGSTSIPFLKAFRDRDGRKNLLLLGEGSIGKSTACTVLYADLLAQGIPVFFYECKSLNDGDMEEIRRVIRRGHRRVIILDAYEEVSDGSRETLHHLIGALNESGFRVVVSSRKNLQEEEATKQLFSGYEILRISRFMPQQIDSIVSPEVKRGSGYYQLLQNTMFLSMHLVLEKRKLLGNVRFNIDTEALFIDQYFRLLYEQKNGKGRNITSRLLDLGKYLHRQRLEGKNRGLPDIPRSLQGIFTVHVPEGKQNAKEILDSVQVKYLNYLHGLYIRERLLDILEDREEGFDVTWALIKLFSVPSTYVYSEAYYYAGQLLAWDDEVHRVLEMLNNDRLKCEINYENVLSLFIGYSNDVATDLECFTFYHPSMVEEPYKYTFICDKIRELSASSITDVRFGYSGFPVLQLIDIQNEYFTSENNCLLRGTTLYLGCSTSKIPSYVTCIRRGAFVQCEDLETLEIPDSVEEMETLAIMRCPDLKSVIIGKGLRRFDEGSIYRCDRLEHLEIRNPRVEAGSEFRGLGARSLSGLDVSLEESVGFSLVSASIPTTMVSYLYRNTWQTLRRLRIFQGEWRGEVRALELSDIDYRNQIEEIVLAKDLTEIEDGGFMKMKNRLTSIRVEEGNPRYIAKGNCLIDCQRGALIRGCNCSVIPDGVRSIEPYAFAWCADLTTLTLPDSVTYVGHDAFRGSGLEEIRLGVGLQRVDAGAFCDCDKLRRVFVDSMPVWLGIHFDSTFSNPLIFAKQFVIGGEAIECLCLPPVAVLPQRAFAYYKGLRRLEIPSELEEIGDHAFVDCTNLEEVHIRDLKAWCNMRFTLYSSNPLASGAELFFNGVAVRDLEFPEEIDRVAFSAFIKCVNLHSITFRCESVRIEDAAFLRCPHLERVTLTGEESEIAEDAFKGCDVVLVTPATVESWKASHKRLSGVRRVICSDGQCVYHENIMEI